MLPYFLSTYNLSYLKHIEIKGAGFDGGYSLSTERGGMSFRNVTINDCVRGGIKVDGFGSFVFQHVTISGSNSGSSGFYASGSAEGNIENLFISSSHSYAIRAQDESSLFISRANIPLLYGNQYSLYLDTENSVHIDRMSITLLAQMYRSQVNAYTVGTNISITNSYFDCSNCYIYYMNIIDMYPGNSGNIKLSSNTIKGSTHNI